MEINKEIPKIIHYCWFGGKPLPKSAIKCIRSWKKFFPDYEIKEWNEDNFDVNQIPYTEQAYKAGKYAFVSDYARFKILYEYGGIYFDTDVEVIKSFEDIINNGPFLGFEIDSDTNYIGKVNPGLGMASYPKLPFFRIVLKRYYNHSGFIRTNGTYNTEDAVVNITTEELIKCGLSVNKHLQSVAGIFVYPSVWFNPFNYITGKLVILNETHSIHWFNNSWSDYPKWKRLLNRLIHKLMELVIENRKI